MAETRPIGVCRRGWLVALRLAIVIFAGALLAGCANSEPLSSGLSSPAQAAPVQTASLQPTPDPYRKTLASKVLSAIALERVTGRKPDPARLIESN
jgi:hypothetical protein